jgi:hypothetical protein
LVSFHTLDVIAALVAAIHWSALSARARMVSMTASTRDNTAITNDFAAFRIVKRQ